uniref:GPN-loop GTPase 3 n=2 Tax=Ditylum brightwellii TaxID=49249 RepID=A0A6U3ZEP1_9STRA|mmetsp:Transcript_6458/g.9531  ORF Transcript_6458/g.9531 Transcript_6458/m.9531 type:complete len:311 (+) Transcript_6458:105-1037(+)
MGRTFIQIVTGPAGSGKSTYCHAIQEHCRTLGKMRRRNVHVANLDPAAENFKYDVAFDIRDLISVDDVMEELGLGPNGSLIYCMEYLLENLDWLQDELDNFDDDEYLILDCPGQIELYTHIPVMRRVIDQMRMWGYESSMMSVFVVDATFVCDAPKFISGSLLSLSAMIAMELPHVNVLSKCDLVEEERVDRILDVGSATELWNIEEYGSSVAIVGDEMAGKKDDGDEISKEERQLIELRRKKRNRLTEAICTLLDDYTMVSFLPLNITDEDSIDHVLSVVDHTVQYGEDIECRGAEQDDFVADDNDGDN